jgi:iron complex transport system ATP-binding protein
MNEPILRLESGAFSYGGRQVFAGLDLAVAAGEVLTVLGTNGSGKSTLLRCLGGALSLTAGAVHLGPDNLRALAPAARARHIGILFQDHAPSLPFSVREVAAMGRTPHLGFLGTATRRDTLVVDRALEEAGVTHLQDRPYTALSGGERQLVLLARTLAQEPRVILMDEPTAHLDLKNQVRCLQTVRALAARGVALIVTTHDPNHAFVLSDRAVLMKAGGPIRVGAVDEVVDAATLSATYGIDIEVYTVPRRHASDSANELKLCSPW